MTSLMRHGPTPPLKWAGGKRWLLPVLTSIISKEHSARRLVEPFVGGMAVTLGLRPQEALLSDINPHLIHFYKWLQRGLVIKAPLENSRDFFLGKRARFNDLAKAGKGSSREASEIFYFLNRTCYNGLCRFNRSGEFNVPFGRYKTINYTYDFSPFKMTFKKWSFLNADFEDLKPQRKDLVYADPPYDVEFRQYSKDGFGWSDQVRLAEWLSKQRCPVITSNQATRRIIELYEKKGFTVKTMLAPRRISCTGDRSAAREMVALKGF